MQKIPNTNKQFHKIKKSLHALGGILLILEEL